MNNQHLSSLQHQPIGIFDSGIGGLSIAQCVAENLPNESILYLADSAYAPYGDLTEQDIQARVNHISDWLISQGCKAIVVACNTATVNAIDQLRQRINVPIIGVEPAIKPATLSSKTKKVAVLSTRATASNKRFLSLVTKHSNGNEVFIQPCKGLVNLIEQGEIDTSACKALLKQYLLPLLEQQIDTLVLGCTHYPFVKDSIQEIVGAKVTIVETAQPVTEQLSRQLKAHQLLNQSTATTNHRFFSSVITPRQTRLFNQLWPSKISLNLFK